MVISMSDVSIRRIDSSSSGQCHESSWVLLSTTLFPAMSGSTWAIVKPNTSTRNLVKASHCAMTGEDLWCEFSFSLSSGSSHHQKDKKKHWGDEIHINLHEVLRLSWGFVDPILPSAKANRHKFVHFCPAFLTIEVSLACQVPFAKQPFRHQISGSCHSTIN